MGVSRYQQPTASAPHQRALSWPRVLAANMLFRVSSLACSNANFLTAGFSWTCSGVSPTLPACLLCSALAVLASGSGVSTERESFMGLVKNEIDRLNEDMGARGSVSMVFHAGGVKVGCLAGRESALDYMSVLVSTKHCRLLGFTCLIVAA